MVNFNRNWFIEFISLIGVVTLIIFLADQISFSQAGEPLLGNSLAKWWTVIALTFLWGCHQLILDLPLQTILASPRVWIYSRRHWIISVLALLLIWAVLYWANPTLTLNQNTVPLLPTEPVHRLWLIFVITLLWGFYNLRLQLPRVLLIGSGESGNTALLEKLAETLPSGKLTDISQKDIDGSSIHIEQFFGEQMVWVSVPGQWWQQPEQAVYQQLRRINALVITVSVAELNSPKDTLNRQSIIDKLYQRYGKILPVYLLITKMDDVVGFSDFFSTEKLSKFPLGISLYSPRKQGSTKQFVEIMGQRFDALQQQLETDVFTAPQPPAELTEALQDKHFRRLVFVGEWQILQSQLQKWVNTHLELDHIHLCGVYFTSAKPTDVPLESTYLKQLADNMGLTVPSIAPTAQRAPFDGVKNAFQLLSDNLAHHSSQKYSQPMTMKQKLKQKLKPILITTAGVVVVSVITWVLVPRPQITFNLTETDLQQVDVFYGTEVELEWQTQHATSTQLIIRSGLEPEGTAPETRPIESSGTQKISVEQPMVATLKASDYFLLDIPLLSSTVEKTLTINLRPPQVTCLSLDGECLIRDHHNPNQPMKATSQPLCYGSETQLSWKVQGAKTISPIFQGSQPTHTEQSSVTLPIDTPTTFMLTATNGIDTVVTELALPLAAPQIECLSVNGQCIDSAQLNDLCFGDTLAIQVKGSCYQSVTSQVQTDELNKTIEETQFSLTPEKPTQLSVIVTNGVNESQKDLAINFKPPVIDCLAVNGQCVESAQLDDLCFGDTLDIQVKGSCYQSLHSELKTDEQLKTIEETQFSLTPDKPTQLSVIATNGVNESKNALAINFKPPVIHTFCGPGSTVAFGSVQPLNWETSCSAKVVLKPVTETPEAPITSTSASGEISQQIKSTRYELTAYNHLGKNAQPAQQVIDLKVATSGLLPVRLPNKPASSFFIQRHEVTQKAYQECDTCEQWADKPVYDSLYCIHGIDWKQKLLLGGQGNSPKAIVCLNAEQAEELLETEEFEQFSYQPSPDDLEISDQALPKECWVSLANSILFGWPGGRLQQENLPAVCVSWKETATYANWKSQQQGLTRCYDKSFLLQRGCNGYRLPTNQEWQWAALGIESQERWFPWGKKRLDCKNLRLQPDCALPLPREVETNGQDLSPFGAKDMGLSVSEWVNDRNGEVVIARGLNYTTFWPLYTDDVRIDDHSDQDENYFIEDRVSNIGFRLVQPLTESQEESRLCVPTDNHK